MGFFDSFKKLFRYEPGGPNKKNLPVIEVNKRFELFGRSGQGSMSKVFRARDRQTGRMVCVKLLDRLKTEKFDARFPGLVRPSEGELSMLLKHPNIVTTFEHGLTTDREQYVVMELIDGVGLNFLIETKSRQLDGHRAHYLSQLADGLEHMHKTGFLHRDVCPRNVMVDQENVLKIIDMGLSIPFTPAFCRPGNRTGTTNYLAPELIKRQTTDHRVDMFALGVTAYETYTGSLPWEKAASLEMLLKLMNSSGRDPREVRADLDAATNAFLKKAVERDPRDRFQTPAEFRDALAALPEQ